jgi:L-amino acid N-acyltransferase YncA
MTAIPAGVAALFPVEGVDRQGEAYVVDLYYSTARDELESFYLHFEPKRAAQGLPPTGADRITRWLGSILPHGIHLVLRRDDGLAGHAFLIPMVRPETAEYAIFLRKDVRCRGIGTAINRLAVDAARAAGFRQIWLSVEPHNRVALRSYTKVGFRLVAGTLGAPEAEMVLDVEPAGAPG